MDRVLCGMHWACCLVYLDDVILFGMTVPEALQCFEKYWKRLSALDYNLRQRNVLVCRWKWGRWVT